MTRDVVTEESAWSHAVRAVAAGADPHREAARIAEEMTPDERSWCLDGDLPFWAGLAELGRGGYHRRPFPTGEVARLGIPPCRFSDGPRGVVIGPATAFPVSMARGATWDVALEERIGDAIGHELRAVGADLYGGVCVNVLRHPQWGRAQETYGEDPHHVGEMGAALTRGTQRHVMACVKHLACNSMENARFTVDVTVDETALHEVFLPHFRRVVDEGVAVVMSAYNSVNGEWCGENRALLTEILRDEWDFDGFVISDWIFGMRDAVKSVRAGLDVEMPYRMRRADALPNARSTGELAETDVVRAVTRVLATRLRFAARFGDPDGSGLGAEGLSGGSVDGSGDDSADGSVHGGTSGDVLACPAHRALAREAASKAAVLLRNEPVSGARVLPLDGTRDVAVVGALAAVRNLGDGGSSDVMAPEAVTVLDGIRAGARGTVSHDDGDDLEAAAAAAARADVAIVVVGYTRADEGEYIGTDGTAHLAELFPGPDDPELAASFERALVEEPGWPLPVESSETTFASGGDRASLELHAHHVALVEAVSAANPRTVVVIIGGSAVIVDPWIESVAACVQGWYSGMEGGHGLADVLFGAAEPHGRLPFSVPTTSEHLPPFDRDATAVVYDEWHGWWLLERDGHTPRFPFGFGLAYTTFELTDVSVTPDREVFVVRARVRNPGARPGTELVQVYAGRDGDRRRLVGFDRVEVTAGSESELRIDIPFERLARRDAANRRWVVEPGAYHVTVARHAADPHAHHVAVDLVTP